MTGDTAGAIESYESALLLRRRRLPPDSLRIAELTSRLGNMLARAGESLRAETLLRESVRIRGEHALVRPTLAAQAHASLAHALLGWGRASEAESEFALSADFYARSLGADHVFTGTVRAGRARALVTCGRYAEAAEEARSAMGIIARARGEGHWEYANAQRHLAAALHGLGRAGEACSLIAGSISTLHAAEAPTVVIDRAMSEAAEYGCESAR